MLLPGCVDYFPGYNALWSSSSWLLHGNTCTSPYQNANRKSYNSMGNFTLHYTPLYQLRKVTRTGSCALATYHFPCATGSKQSKNLATKMIDYKLIHIILHILCCIKSDNIILRLFLSPLLENDSTATPVSVNFSSAKFTVSRGSLHTRYTIGISRNAQSFG